MMIPPECAAARARHADDAYPDDNFRFILHHLNTCMELAMAHWLWPGAGVRRDLRAWAAPTPTPFASHAGPP